MTDGIAVKNTLLNFLLLEKLSHVTEQKQRYSETALSGILYEYGPFNVSMAIEFCSICPVMGPTGSFCYHHESLRVFSVNVTNKQEIIKMSICFRSTI
ncbi:hypothetical protein T06_10058 [Trichinella sp. T6]|nr:hypothetical protein T06_10058 [Trichinella sp. T6]